MYKNIFIILFFSLMVGCVSAPPKVHSQTNRIVKKSDPTILAIRQSMLSMVDTKLSEIASSYESCIDPNNGRTTAIVGVSTFPIEVNIHAVIVEHQMCGATGVLWQDYFVVKNEIVNEIIIKYPPSVGLFTPPLLYVSKILGHTIYLSGDARGVNDCSACSSLRVNVIVDTDTNFQLVTVHSFP